MDNLGLSWNQLKELITKLGSLPWTNNDISITEMNKTNLLGKEILFLMSIRNHP